MICLWAGPEYSSLVFVRRENGGCVWPGVLLRVVKWFSSLASDTDLENACASSIAEAAFPDRSAWISGFGCSTGLRHVWVSERGCSSGFSFPPLFFRLSFLHEPLCGSTFSESGREPLFSRSFPVLCPTGSVSLSDLSLDWVVALGSIFESFFGVSSLALTQDSRTQDK